MADVKAGPSIPADVDPATVAGVAVGGYVCSPKAVPYHADLPVTKLKVRNTGDRPVQVGSHFHFFALACAAALATIEAYEEEGVFENARKVGAYLGGRLEELKAKHAVDR